MSPQSTVNTSRMRNAAMCCLTMTGRRFIPAHFPNPGMSWTIRSMAQMPMNGMISPPMP